MANIKVYHNNPTAGATDGTAASENGTGTSPITVTLDSSSANEAVVPLAVRCTSGYHTVGNTVITPTGTSASKWSLCATQNGTFTSTLTIGSSIGSTNTLFYAKATCTAGEAAQNDTSVSFEVETKIGAD